MLTSQGTALSLDAVQMTTTSVVSRPRAKQCVRRHLSQHRAGAVRQLALGRHTDEAKRHEVGKAEESQPQLEEKQYRNCCIPFNNTKIAAGMKWAGFNSTDIAMGIAAGMNPGK